jgi:hypothetical protein
MVGNFLFTATGSNPKGRERPADAHGSSTAEPSADRWIAEGKTRIPLSSTKIWKFLIITIGDFLFTATGSNPKGRERPADAHDRIHLIELLVCTSIRCIIRVVKERIDMARSLRNPTPQWFWSISDE